MSDANISDLGAYVVQIMGPNVSEWKQVGGNTYMFAANAVSEAERLVEAGMRPGRKAAVSEARILGGNTGRLIATVSPEDGLQWWTESEVSA